MPTRELSVGEKVVVRKALADAVGLCDKVVRANDAKLGAVVSQEIHLRPTPARLQGIRQEFQKVEAALSQTPLQQIVRGVGDPDFAEVEPNRPYHITLGDAFFTAPRGHGIDTCAGTLIHEATHWNIVRGSDDHAYQDLSNLSAALARNNAQSLERIVELLA